MAIQQQPLWHRRHFLRSMAVTCGAGILGLRSSMAATEPPPEITSIRLLGDPNIPVLCYAPQFVATEFLRLEGFTDINYVPYGPEGSDALGLVNDQLDITAGLAGDMAVAIDQGGPITILGGLHIGCTEIIANKQINSIRNLKHKRVAVTGMQGAEHILVAIIASYIGLDPHKDIEWIVAYPSDWVQMFAEGKIDAIAAFPPMNYELHANNFGHVILNTVTDEPWRHYFCCLVGARQEFIENYPIATKRAFRAIYKASQLCSLEPQRAAQFLVDNGFASRYDYALQTLKDIPYAAWRSYDPEDTLRFYSLRLREAGFIKHTPQEIIEKGTNWRFLNELKRELKV